MGHKLSWAAGIFEGEGAITPRKTEAPHLWQLSMSSTDEDVVRAFHDAIGVGKVYGPYGYVNGKNRRREHHKQYWRWAVSDKLGIERAGALLWPHLMSRRRKRLEECLKAVALTPFTRKTHVRNKCSSSSRV